MEELIVRPTLRIVEPEEIFPGSRLFTAVQASQIGELLNGIHKLTLVPPNDPVNEFGVALSYVETTFVNAGLVAHRTANILGVTLTRQEFFHASYDSTKRAPREPEEIPQTVLDIVLARESNPDDAA